MTTTSIARALHAKYGLFTAHRLIRQRVEWHEAAGDLHRLFRWVGIGLALHDPALNWSDDAA